MTSYDVLNARSPELFLVPELFVTDYDGRKPGYGEEQYVKGLKISQESMKVVIRASGTWMSVHMPRNPRTPARDPYLGYTCSYEGIGYHGHTADLLRGFLDGPAPLYVERYIDPDESCETETTLIKGAYWCPLRLF